MYMNTSAQRRSFLKLVGAASLGALTLPFARTVLAEGSRPRRAIFVFFPDGMVYEDWHAQGTGTNFTLPGMTKPLDRVREHCIFLNGVDMYGPGSTHEGGITKLLTGGPGGGQYLFGGNQVSLDYYLGQQFKNQTIRPHLNLGIVPIYRDKPITYDLTGIPVMPEMNPMAAFSSLFGAENNNNYVNQRRQNTVGALATELSALRSRLGNHEKTKLDMHLDSLRELEKKLGAATTGGCPAWNFNPTNFKVTRTQIWLQPEYLDGNNVSVVSDLQMDIAVHALACDLTRVVTLVWNNSVNDLVIKEAGVYKTCHHASHEGGADFVKIKAWYTNKLAQLIEHLRNTPDGNGTLLDNTAIFVGSDLAHGAWHNHASMPFILAGGAAGGWVGGRSLKFNNVAHNKILVSIAQFMGLNINKFGTEDSAPGSLPGLMG